MGLQNKFNDFIIHTNKLSRHEFIKCIQNAHSEKQFKINYNNLFYLLKILT